MKPVHLVLLIIIFSLFSVNCSHIRIGQKKTTNTNTTTVYEEPDDTTSEKPKTTSEKELASTKTLSKTQKVEQRLIKYARKYLGTRHQMGGMTKKGIDCSGLMCITFREENINLPRRSADQSSKGIAVKKSDLKLGDLLFFGAKKGSKVVTHVGMVTDIKGKRVKFIHTSTRRGVVEDDFYFKHWQDTFIKARRIL